MNRIVLLNLLFFISFSVFSQQKKLNSKKQNSIYLTWGYTRAWYSNSTIHFKDLSNNYHWESNTNNYYDFKIYNAKAADKPDFNKAYDLINITTPQFVFRIGYTFSKNWGFEINYDHTKYVVNDWQNVKIKGQIFGRKVDGDTLLDPRHFLHFEHTDGANFFMFNAVRRLQLYKPSKNFEASLVIKPGAGFVYPRTDVTIFGERLNNQWHVAGWIAGVESGLRLEFRRNGFFELVGKGTYANYTKSLVLGKGNGAASHSFWCGQLTATLGVKIATR